MKKIFKRLRSVRRSSEQRSSASRQSRQTVGEEASLTPSEEKGSPSRETRGMDRPTVGYDAKNTVIVGAIDFGTTFSGWAFSFLHEFQSNPTQVTVKQWRSGGTLITEKAPSCVLIRPDGETLEAFGYNAENRYKELVDAGEHKEYFYFKRFKMLLKLKFGQKLNRQVTIKDNMGKSLPAMTVFSKTILYLTNDMLEIVQTRLRGTISKQDITWVLTVPAIWTDSAKQFMREAAVKAGIDTSKLIIALEPEAASIYCRHLPVDMTVDKQDVSISKFPAGTKYMVLDAGGGTIDITVHEVETSGGLKEVHAASGGGFGGILVDEAFKNLLIDLVGENVYERFMKEEPEDCLDLWRDFEVKKKDVRPDKSAKIVMRFPLSLVNMFEKKKQQKLADAIANSKYANSITFAGDKLKCEASVMKSLFDNPLQKTVEHVKTLMRHKNVRDVKAVLMVGGYSDSAMLQHAIRSTFPGIDVIIPTDASSTILKGAVIFGHSPKAITERVLQYTYGIATRAVFEEGIHPKNKKVVLDCGERCKDVFSKHVERDQSIKIDQALDRQAYRPCNYIDDEIPINIYATQMKNPMYVDEQGCTQIGATFVKLPDHDGSLERKIWVSFMFGGTEIIVKGEDDKTGETVSVTVNFLG